MDRGTLSNVLSPSFAADKNGNWSKTRQSLHASHSEISMLSQNCVTGGCAGIDRQLRTLAP